MPTATKLKSTTTAVKTKTPGVSLAPGHRACAGCGQLIAARTVVEALGPNTIIANATGCLEVTTTPYPESAWGMPWIHSLFENAPAIASGILAALRYKSKNGKTPIPKIVAQGGDGSTFDIGFGLISGMWERHEDILYICYDNEAYANTGVQASGSTPPGASTTTTPAGALTRKKDMTAIALAHGCTYVAQTTAGFPLDIAAKIKKALTIPGPGYIQIAVPCIPGWHIDPAQTIALGKKAAQTGMYPIFEYVNGQLSSAMKVPNPAPRVEEYLKAQGRFSHLFKTPEGKQQIEQLQKIADENIIKYNLK